MSRKNTPEDFWNRVRKTNDCWIWLGGKSGGYGCTRYHGKIVRAYRLAYEFIKGPIPKNLQIDHLCRNEICVNPDHLEAVPIKLNILRGKGPTAINARKTHCKYGHEFTKENTQARADNGRRCRTCVKNRYKVKFPK